MVTEREFGEQVTKARLAAALTQRQLAHQAGVSTRTLQGLEAGTGSSLRTLLAIADALDKNAWVTDLHKDVFSPIAFMATLEGKPQRQRAFAPRSRRRAGE